MERCLPSSRCSILGVPQRRKRIYLVADFAGGRAFDILFKSEGLSGVFCGELPLVAKNCRKCCGSHWNSKPLLK